MKDYEIAGYSYRADIYCGDCVIDKLGVTGPFQGTDEEMLDSLAQERGIDRENERSFDSGDFPKPLLRWEAKDNHDHCSNCGRVLAE